MVYSSIFLASVPSLAIIAIGYLSVLLNVMQLESMQNINGFLVNFCLPALMFRLVVNLDLSSVQLSYVYCSLLHRLGSLIFAAISSFSIRRLPYFLNISPNVFIFATFSTLVWTNSIIIGLPVAQVLFGTPSLDYLVISGALDTIMLLPISILLLGQKTSQTSLSRYLFRSIFTSFSIMSVIIGTLFKIILKKIPFVINQFLIYLGQAVTGGCLFIVGMFFFKQIKELNQSKIEIIIPTEIIEAPAPTPVEEEITIKMVDDPQTRAFFIYCFVSRLIFSPFLMFIITKLIKVSQPITSYLMYSVCLPLAIACFSVSKQFNKATSGINYVLIVTHLLIVPLLVIYSFIFKFEVVE
ncbi:hypothetical protein RCL1_005079 [Eukaryota sp. TZLM3-RCL]